MLIKNFYGIVFIGGFVFFAIKKTQNENGFESKIL